MRFSSKLLVLAVAVIPLWYTYRSFGEKRRAAQQDEIVNLREELKQATESLKAAREKRTVENRDDANCIKEAHTARSKYVVFLPVRDHWQAMFSKVSTTSAGAAIAANADYVRAFREFSEEGSKWAALSEASFLKTEKACLAGEKDKDDFLPGKADLLDRWANDFESAVEALRDSEKKITGLVELANGRVAESLEAAVYRQTIADAVVDYRTKRGDYIAMLRSTVTPHYR